ncbi:MAG: GNAT family N-acetyltransferase [Formosimonas sp.]
MPLMFSAQLLPIDWPTQLVLRKAVSDDAGFYYRVTYEVLSAYVVQTWGEWDEKRTWQNAQEFVASEGAWIWLVDGWSAGLIEVQTREAELYVVDVYVLPEYQGQGLARAVMQHVIDYARHSNRSIRLGVLRVNVRAQRFYQRLGFVCEREDEQYFYMVLNP